MECGPVKVEIATEGPLRKGKINNKRLDKYVISIKNVNPEGTVMFLSRLEVRGDWCC